MDQLKHMAKYLAVGMLLSAIVFYIETRLFYKTASIDLINDMSRVGLFFIMQSIFLAVVFATIIHLVRGMKDVRIERKSLTRNETTGLIALLSFIAISIALPCISAYIFYFLYNILSFGGMLLFIYFGSSVYKDVRKSFSTSFLLFGIAILIWYKLLIGFTIAG